MRENIVSDVQYMYIFDSSSLRNSTNKTMHSPIFNLQMFYSFGLLLTDVIKQLEKHGKVHFDLKENQALLSQDLRSVC